MEEDVCEIYARQCELDHRKRGHIRFGSDDFRPVLLVSGKKSCLDAEQRFIDPIIIKISSDGTFKGLKGLKVAIFHRSLRTHLPPLNSDCILHGVKAQFRLAGDPHFGKVRLRSNPGKSG